MVLRKSNIKFFVFPFLGFVAIALLLIFGGTKAQAKTIKITKPEQMRNLNWKGKGFGPGTYKLGNGMTLTDDLSSDENGTCLLTKGKFVIDLNGHTLQSADKKCTVISVRGATVVLKDSKAKKASRKRPSIRSYGAGAVEITSGKLTIKNGYYCGASNGQNNPVGLHVGGGTCTVQGGTFDGDHVGASTMGGKLRINGGTFKTSYMFGLLNMAGKIKITKATIKNTKSNSFNPTFAIGAYTGGNSYSFKNWLASGSRFSPTITSYYWNGSSTEVSQTPIGTELKGSVYVPKTFNYAVGYTGNSGYEPVTIKVISSVKSIKKKAQTITAKSFTKTYGNKAFGLKAKTSGNGNLSYKSSNKKVATVSSKGKVTIKGCGKAAITIKASATSKYKAASKKITITVKPAKVKTKYFNGNKKSLKIYYAKQKNVDGYQCVYNRGKKSIKTTSKKNYVTLKNLKKGICTAKIRAYKMISGKKVYGKYGKYQLTVS